MKKPRSTPPPRRAAPADPLAGKTVQLKITLRSSAPSIWRRVVVPGDIGLPALHDVFQAVMGWEDSHLHLFAKGRTIYREPDFERGFDGEEALDEADFSLAALGSRAGATFVYEYDFGDCWLHDVKVEKVEPVAQRPARAVCLEGVCAVPPDDTGGVWGYATKVAALADPQHPDYEEMRAWFGADFDPTRFELAKVNRLLGKIRV
ncbi:MAG: plasmid pRiA4b ORF-3 family protein [Opitutae bacterium]|nr:plasmid pRiA4b ORF-3 family protein [Opitutae bacterium]